MKVIMVMFDSLNRHMLEPYGGNWVKTPNFRRLAERSVVFDTCYGGSMPCMPARRELHTGRYNFLHRSWGPMEPFDDSMPEILKRNGAYSHLVSDHYHYWEDGGCTYHTRYSTWDCVRGQEGDPWMGQVVDPDIPATAASEQRTNNPLWRQDWINRKYMAEEADQPQPKTFARGMDFMRRNAGQDNWFLQIETFDPHEPYFSPQRFKDKYPHQYKGRHFDWPPYREVRESAEEIEHCRLESAALHSMCDEYLGKVLDLMDELDLWKDTLLIVNTDHGFLMGEHDLWAKCHMPFYEEVIHSPLFIWDPRSAVAGQRRQALVQTIDLPATILEAFGIALPADTQGLPLRQTIIDDRPVRQAALFGIHGGQVNVTDGRYVYMRAPADKSNAPLYNYTLMPTHMRGLFSLDELQPAELAKPFSFTKGCPTLKTPGNVWRGERLMTTRLYDVQADPKQENPLDDAEVEQMMIDHLVRLMKSGDAPPEQFQRLGLADRA